MFNKTAKEFLRLERFIHAYCPTISNVKHKLRGIDGNKKPIDFSEEEKALIEKALRKFSKEII